MAELFKLRLAGLWKGVKAQFDFGDVLFVAAVAAVGYGLAQIYPPAAWIIVGVIFIVVTSRKPGGEQ